MFDVIIIGAGVTGAAAAWGLARFQGKVCVLEKAEDVCCGTSKANSGIVHAGFDAIPGTRKAYYNIEGSRMMEQLCKNLKVPYQRCGALVVCDDLNFSQGLEELYQKGIANGVEGLEIITDQKRLRELEPNISPGAAAALYAPTSAVVCPFELNLAMAEQAKQQGTEFYFNTEVQEIEAMEGGYRLETSRGRFESRYVVNAAGVYADYFHNMVSEKKIHITPRKGEYCLLDKGTGSHVFHTIFALPDKMGKGVLVTPTAHGNLLLGPTATDIENREGVGTTAEGLEKVMADSAHHVRDIPVRQVITSFAGLRAHEDGDDFIIGEPKDAPGFYDCAGIESPGLTSAPAIGKEAAEVIAKALCLKENPDFSELRKGQVHLSELTLEEQRELIRKDPAYGNIICRCETISEGEIRDALRSPLGAKSLDGVKRRTRAGMGRCQGGFCSPRVMELIARERGISQEEVTKAGGNSKVILAVTKEGTRE
ncbi:MAG: NAD(P)/FAD-dependent oxidoreductase [Lachnospiraceae bacterium]|nr:NAD(P)/FAD-dependent oxidoreductase [Lachnospiraceae bacterium]